MISDRGIVTHQKVKIKDYFIYFMILYKFFQKLRVDSIFDGKPAIFIPGVPHFRISIIKQNAERVMLFLRFWSECRDSFAFSQELQKLRIATV